MTHKELPALTSDAARSPLSENTAKVGSYDLYTVADRERDSGNEPDLQARYAQLVHVKWRLLAPVWGRVAIATPDAY